MLSLQMFFAPLYFCVCGHVHACVGGVWEWVVHVCEGEHTHVCMFMWKAEGSLGYHSSSFQLIFFF